MIEVPNKFPELKSLPYRIAFIGEAPGADEESMQECFVGPTGHILKQLMSSAGLLSSGCYFGNISQTRAPGDNASRLSWEGWQIQSGLQVLKRDMDQFNPNVVVLMGNLACKSAGYGFPASDGRGSLFNCADLDSPFYGRKCLVTIHPARLFREWDLMPLFQFDLCRAKEEGLTKELILPDREFLIDLSPDEIIQRLNDWPKGLPCSMDIEGGIEQGITCIAFAESPLKAFIVDYTTMGEDVKPRMIKAVGKFLADPQIPKILQNQLYDNFCLSWKHLSPIANVFWDTMLSGWEIYPELRKSLGVQTSIWTREPYYKYERKVADHRTHLKYCCKDATVTYEIAEAHQKHLTTELAGTGALDHFNFNMSLLPAFMYMQLRGIKFDKERARERLLEVNVEMSEIQSRINVLAGGPLNVNSPKQMNACLYDRLGFEVQYKKEGGRKTDKKTCDLEALLTILRRHNPNIVFEILQWRQKDSLREQLDTTTTDDGRIRASYNVVGTDTGRLSCSTSNAGSGFNLQTVMALIKTLCITDDGCYMADVDLQGADGWTVAAHSARLGDDSMLNDYLAGVKPARVIAAMYLTGDKSIANLPSSQLLEITSNLDIPKWLYNACKAVQHGSCYGMGNNTTSSNILKRSWKDSGVPVYVSPKDCGLLQSLFFVRYVGVLRWQSWVKNQLNTKGYLESASGHVRHFFGRKQDNSTLQAALAHEPQINTTFATNLALKRLWQREDNRYDNGKKLFVEPLHQVHDSLVSQFKIEHEALAKRIIPDCFHNPLTIAGMTLTIPFEGGYGKYWGDSSAGHLSL